MVNSVGIIGLGQMGNAMARGFAMTGVVPENQLFIYDRNPEKIKALKDEFPGINHCESSIEVAKNSRYLIISIKPPAIPGLINKLSEYILPSANLFLSSSNVRHADIKRLYDGKITTFLPTVNSAVLRGVIFACHNEKVSGDEKLFFDKIMGAICTRVCVVKEEDFGVVNNLAGCMPAFLAGFLCTFVDRAKAAAVDFSEEELAFFAQETFIATGMLLEEQKTHIKDIIKKVGHPGGITLTALGALDDVLPLALDDLISRSVKRHSTLDLEVKEAIDSIVDNQK